jgi:UDP-glucose 4-epimerase
MKALVTGGAGLIGSRIVKSLLADGYTTLVLDNLSSGKEKNLAELRKFTNFEFHLGTILDKKEVHRLMREADVCFHFAAALGVQKILKDPFESLRTNIEGTENVLLSAHDLGTPLVLASTSEIYGKNPNMPLREDSDRLIGTPDIIRWSYSEAKAIDESMAFALSRNSDWNVKILRFFNTVGPSQNSSYGMVIPNFCRAAVRNEDLIIHGSGAQSRVFLHVDDAVSAIRMLEKCDLAKGRAVNVGGIEEITILELAEKIIKLANSNSRIRLIPYDQLRKEGFEDIERRVPDISLLRELIEWEPRITLHEILEQCIRSAHDD